MSKASDKKSTFSNQEGTHILQSSHFSMLSRFPLHLLVIRLPRTAALWCQRRPLRIAMAGVGGRAAER